MSLRKQATAGLVWTFAQQFSNQIIAFVVSIILARILLPEQFGLIGMVSVFIAVGNTLMDAGLTQSLIRDKDADQEDLSTVFYFNLAASAVIYLIIFFSAPLIAGFYEEPSLTKIVRVLCVTFVISAFGAIQSTRLTKVMNFKTQTLISVPSTVVSGIVGVSMAYSGFGVWSLVWSRVSASLMRTAQLWVYSKWTPSLQFNIPKFKDHFNFGYKLTLSSLLDTIFSNIYIIVIGKYFAASQVGFYVKSQSLKNLPVNNISSALNKVTYPLFAQIQEDDVRLKRVYKQIMQMVVFIIAPILIFAAVLAEPTFRLLLTEKWLPAVPYFQILCVTGILYPLNSYNLNVLKVKGRSDLFLKLEIIKKVLIIIGILIAIQFGIYALLYTQAILSIIAFYINSYNTGNFINYSSWEQTKDIFPIIIIGLCSGAIIYFTDLFLVQQEWLDIFRILFGGVLGLLVYFLISFILKKDVVMFFKKIILKK
ncbi:lipopolysaccharide biosynthesis protein [uncultured Salegentibacter sp.]|uniref:lipopolysaccharide biosynthesis protein n=1 Tax=uncultured Salegentibacter sp. TaxID=259320 RepID=UPI00259A39E9|nr:lipopolysaccharide biosynthesis protein [uncultured Salegentibacter sp.]